MSDKKQIIKENSIAQAKNLESLIDYQTDSVVSKTIIGKKAGTVTMFAFDKDQGLSEHTAPYDAMVYMVDGEARITISGKAIIVKKGEMVILPANEPHALEALSKYKMLLIMIKSE
jgi:quercetin dioxygenase-like cupin family protein